MPMKIHYPRVLILYNNCINAADQHGVSIRGWFADWPKENLAQVYSGGEVGEGRFCGRSFKLGPEERRFGSVFFGLKGSSLGESSQPVVPLTPGATGAWSLPLFTRVKRAVGGRLLNSGLWELLFRPRLSRRLEGWLREFRPEVIYCQGYTLGFSWLPVIIQRALGIPICFQTGDDWPTSLYASSPFSFLMVPAVRAAAERLVGAADVRLSNGEGMSEEYLRRYGAAFEPLMMCDEFPRFRAAEPQRVVESDRVAVVYSGQLGLGRVASLVDCCLAAHELEAEGIQITVVALATSVPPELMELLQRTPNLLVRPAPGHEELPGYLKGADVLLLPESFDDQYLAGIRFSISTKAHLYMMSERPALIYGRPEAGSMDYARRQAWGARVDRRDRQALKDALRALATDAALRERIAARGREIALRQHDSAVVRERMRQVLSAAIRGAQQQAT